MLEPDYVGDTLTFNITSAGGMTSATVLLL